jgi:cytochrome c biogenesis factor
MLMVPGGILAGLALGILGTARSRAGLVVAGAAVVFVESVPLMFSFAPLAVLTSGAFLLLARKASPISGAASAARIQNRP